MLDILAVVIIVLVLAMVLAMAAAAVFPETRYRVYVKTTAGTIGWEDTSPTALEREAIRFVQRRSDLTMLEVVVEKRGALGGWKVVETKTTV